MSIWALIQIVFDLAVFVALAAAWLRLRRPPQDDPRLSRGLQLLQTKITVLEDLSDRTDAQVKQLTSLLDQKARIVQNKIVEAEQQVLKIDHSMNKSLEVAEIFQDKIPHGEILERQRTVEYVKAARMAHSGLGVEEIAERVHLPREQVELIAKFNREQLMFDEDQLPEWAQKASDAPDASFTLKNMDFVNNLETKQPDLTGSEKIQKEFRQAVQDAKQVAETPIPTLLDNKVADSLRATVASGVESLQPAVKSLKAGAQTLRERLVSTAEDLLRQPTEAPAAPGPAPAQTATPPPAPRKFNVGSPIVQSGEVKRVIFPRIEK